MIGVEKKDRGKFLFCLFMQFVFWFTYQIAWNLVHTILVKRLGIEALPYSYILCNAVNMVSAILFILYIDKIPKMRFLQYLCTLQIIFLIVSREFLSHTSAASSSFDNDLVFSIILIIISQSVLYTLMTAIWAVTNELFRPSQARKLYPLLNIGGLFGGFTAGCAIPVYVHLFGVSNLLELWIISMGLIVLSTMYGRRYFNNNADQEVVKYSNKTTLQELRRYISVSSTVKALILIIIFTRVVTNVEDFQYTQVMNLSFPSEASLSSYFGYYSILWSVTAFLLQFFVAQKLLLNVGIFRGLFFLPIATGLCFIWLIFDFNFWAGFFLNYLWGMISIALQTNAYQLSFNVVPSHIRGRIRGVIDGLASSSGGLLGGVLLIVLNSFTGQFGNFQYIIVSLLGVVLCFGWVVAVAYGRRHYIKDLVYNLYAGNRITILDTLESMEERREPAATKGLLEILHSNDPKFDQNIKVKVMEVLARLSNPDSLRSLSIFLKEKEAYLRTNAIKGLYAFRNINKYSIPFHYLINEMRELFRNDPFGPGRLEAGKFLIKHTPSKDLPPYILGLLHDPDKYARISIMESIGQLNLPFSDMILLNLLEDADPEIRSKVILHLYSYPEYRKRIEIVLDRMITSDIVEEVKYGLIALTRIRDQHAYISKVQNLLQTENSVLRGFAALFLVSLTAIHHPDHHVFHEKLIEALVDPKFEGIHREELIRLLVSLDEKHIDELFDNIQELEPEKRVLAQRGLHIIASLLYQRIEEEYFVQSLPV